jgi:hypothetical protein
MYPDDELKKSVGLGQPVDIEAGKTYNFSADGQLVSTVPSNPAPTAASNHEHAQQVFGTSRLPEVARQPYDVSVMRGVGGTLRTRLPESKPIGLGQNYDYSNTRPATQIITGSGNDLRRTQMDEYLKSRSIY